MSNQAIQVAFNEAKGFASYKNATKKADKILGPYAEQGENVRFIIHINESGRYLPVAINYPSWAMASIAQAGVCVV